MIFPIIIMSTEHEIRASKCLDACMPSQDRICLGTLIQQIYTAVLDFSLNITGQVYGSTPKVLWK